MSLSVSTILNNKGSDVATIGPDDTVAAATEALAQHNVGALVVSSDGRKIDGIISERDIVRQLGKRGTACLEKRVSDVMSTVIITCTIDACVDELMATMTRQRFRHMPVVTQGELAGMISIGDVVKARLDELEVQAETLEQYVTGSLA